MNSRNDFIFNAFQELKTRIADHPPFNLATKNEEEVDFLEKFDFVLSSIQKKEVDYSFQAQDVLTQFIRCYANLVPLIRRELLWFIGGECLHYLGDEEFQLFQELEERLYQLEQQNVSIDIDAQIKLLRDEANSIQNSTKH